MLNWFRSPPTCPIEPETRAWIDRRWNWLEGEFGRDRMLNCPVVLPRARFFPDRYTGRDEAEVQRLLERVCGYMDIDPEKIKLYFYDESGPVEDEDRKGTAGLYHEEDGKAHLGLEVHNLEDPLTVVATMVHELGHVHLLGDGRISHEGADHEPLTDLLSVYFGMGVFLANAVVRERYWNEGQWSGWSIGGGGYLTMPDFGYAFALLARARNEDKPVWAKELRLDVRAAFKQSMRLLDHESRGEHL